MRNRTSIIWMAGLLALLANAAVFNYAENIKDALF